MSTDDPVKPLTWDHLAAKLELDPRALRRLKLRDDAPPTTDLDAWRDFLARLDEAKRTAIGIDGLPGTCEYDDAVGRRKLTYSDAKKREEVNEQLLKNEALRLEMAQRRKALLTRDQARQFQSDLIGIFRASLALVPEMAQRDVPAHERAGVKAVADQMVAAVLAKLDSELAAWTGPQN